MSGARSFQPTLPLRGATDDLRFRAGLGGVSTHAPLAGSDYLVPRLGYIRDVSTHAPLAGSDIHLRRVVEGRGVSTHAPLAGSDMGL